MHRNAKALGVMTPPYLSLYVFCEVFAILCLYRSQNRYQLLLYFSSQVHTIEPCDTRGYLVSVYCISLIEIVEEV